MGLAAAQIVGYCVITAPLLHLLLYGFYTLLQVMPVKS